MWAGSYFGGVNYLPNTYPQFERFVPQGNMHGRRVREIVQDRDGRIWIGTEDEGLNYMNPLTGEIKYVAESEKFPNIHGLCVDGDRLWVGTFSYGLRVIDTRTQRVVRTYTASKASGSLRDNTILSITRAPDGSIYLGTIRGLCRYNAATDGSTTLPAFRPSLSITSPSTRKETCGWPRKLMACICCRVVVANGNALPPLPAAV